MPFETGFIGLLRKIVCKIHINDVLPQIAYIVHVQNVGVFLAVPLGIHLSQFTLTDTGDSMKKHLAVIHQQFVELNQLLFPAHKPAAGFQYITVKNEVPDGRRKIARCQKLFGTHIPLFKSQLHGEAEDVGDKHCFIVVVLEGKTV